MFEPGELEKCASALLESGNVLIFTHHYPDGDAMGASFGLKYFLESQGKKAEVFLACGIPRRHIKLFSGALTDLSEEKLAGFDTFVALDCANPERLILPEWLSIEALRKMRFINIDHHRGNSLASNFINLIVSESSSTCELLVNIVNTSGIKIGKEAATAWLSGMMTDTGCFQFSQTRPLTLRNAAMLLEQGAELENISNALFRSKPLNHVKFRNEMMSEHFSMASDGRIAYVVITDELLEKYSFNLKDDESLIDNLREIDGVVISMMVYPGKGGSKISLRSNDSSFPVEPVARQFGGGGHLMAAGATLDMGCAEAARVMLEKLQKLFD